MADPSRDYSKLKIVDYLEHHKSDTGEEIITFPITRAENVIGGPVMTTSIDKLKLATMGILVSDDNVVDVDTTIINNILGISIL